MKLWLAYILGMTGIVLFIIHDYGYGIGGEIMMFGLIAFPIVLGFNYIRKKIHPKQIKSAI